MIHGWECLLTTGWISSSSENSVFSQSDLAVIAMATVHLSLIAEKSDSGSSFNGCSDNNSSLSYREKLIVEQRRQSSAKSTSMSRCVNNSSFIHPRLAANSSMKLVELFVQCRRFWRETFLREINFYRK